MSTAVEIRSKQAHGDRLIATLRERVDLFMASPVRRAFYLELHAQIIADEAKKAFDELRRELGLLGA